MTRNRRRRPFPLESAVPGFVEYLQSAGVRGWEASASACVSIYSRMFVTLPFRMVMVKTLSHLPHTTFSIERMLPHSNCGRCFGSMLLQPPRYELLYIGLSNLLWTLQRRYDIFFAMSKGAIWVTKSQRFCKALWI